MANSGVHVMWHRFRCARGGGARMRHAGAYTKQGRYKYSGENDRFHRRASHQGSQPTRGSGVQRALVAVYSRHGVMFGHGRANILRQLVEASVNDVNG